MKTVEVDHPLVRHKLGKLRDIATDPVHFRQLAGEIAALLAFEATRDLPCEVLTVQTWAGPLEVQHVRGEDLTLVPILRAGLGFLPGVQALLPAAPVSVTQPVIFLQLIWATLLGWFAFGERVDPYVMLGGAIIISAISYMSWREAQIARAGTTPPPDLEKS